MVTKQAFTTATDENLTCDGQLLKKLAGAALVWLEQNYEHVNRLNVFPVPDGDTGTNMLLTMREAYHQIADSDETNVSKVAQAIAYGALNGARGNSGTIMSQLWQGLAQGLGSRSAFDAAGFADACDEAVRMAYHAVITPTEGTILTVAREAAEAVRQRIEEDDERNLVAALKTMVFAARASLRRTPMLLPILKQAGVVDSGGQGLVYMLEGMLQYLSGKTFLAPVAAESTPDSWQQALTPDDEAGYGYDVQFRMHGSGLDVEAIRQAIDALGWSTVVVGTPTLIKVHVHVHDPGVPISYVIGLGAEIDDVVVENMQMQYKEFVQERLDREASGEATATGTAVIAVAPGAGLRKLFLEELQAARVISGGQTMNPSTGDFLALIHDLPNEDIILLPNNKNILLAAKQAAEMIEGKRVRVVPTRSIPQGVSAMLLAYRGAENLPVDEIAEAMSEAASSVISGEITTATRDVELNGVTVKAGDLIGLLDDKLVVAGNDMLGVARALLDKADVTHHELVTLYHGIDISPPKAAALVEALQAAYPRQEFQLIYGGQPLYPCILAIE